MSRNRKPIEQQKGNLTVKQKLEITDNQARVVGPKDILESNIVPKDLSNAIAKKEYLRIKNDLIKLDIVCDLDMNNIVFYCNAYANYFLASKQLENEDLVLKRITNMGESYYKNPLIQVQREFADEMRKFANQIGLSVDSRLKISATKGNEMSKDISDSFGDI